MECEKCKAMRIALDKMESAVKQVERNMGWKIPVYALVALRELKLHVSLAKEKLEEPVKAP